MDLVEFVKKNAEKFAAIPEAAATVEKLAGVMKELNHAPLANDISNPAKPGYMPIGRFDEVITQKNQLKTQADELNGQLEELKKAAKGNEELTKQIADLQAKAAEADEKVKQVTLLSAAKVAAVAAKANDPEDVLKFIDHSKLVLDGDKVIGLDEQLKSLQESKAYLFATEDKPKGNKGDANDDGKAPTETDYSKMSDKEFAAARGYTFAAK